MVSALQKVMNYWIKDPWLKRVLNPIPKLKLVKYYLHFISIYNADYNLTELQKE